MAAKVIKYFLEILSDATFLSSIEYFDFKHRYVSIRRDFFNLCFEIVSSNTKILRPRRFGIILKELFLKRFCSISSTNLKKFFDYKISNSYFDYLNIARYYTAMLREDKIDFDKFFRNYLNKRNFKYYEKKGYKYFLYTLTPTFRKLDSKDNQQQQHENVESSHLSSNIEILDVQQTISDINIAIESDEEEVDDDHSYTSSEMREWLESEDIPFESTSLDIIQLNHFNQTSLPSNDEYLDMIESNSLPNATPLISNTFASTLRNQITSNLTTIYELENTETSYDNFDDFESDFNAVESRIESSRREISSLTNDLLSNPEYNDSELM